MATLSLDQNSVGQGKQVRVELSAKEAFGALAQSFTFPMTQIESIDYVDDPLDQVTGFRVGTMWPGQIKLGRFFHHDGQTDFAATYGNQPGYVITLRKDPGGARYARVIVSSPRVDGLVTPEEPGNVT